MCAANKERNSHYTAQSNLVFFQSISSSCETGVVTADRAANVGEPTAGAGAAAPVDARPGQRCATPPAVLPPATRPGDCGGRPITGLLGFEPRPPGAGERPRCGDCGTRDTVRRGDVAIASGGIAAANEELEPRAGKLAAERISIGGFSSAPAPPSAAPMVVAGAAGCDGGGGGGCSGGAGLAPRGDDATASLGGGNGGLAPSAGGGGRGEMRAAAAAAAVAAPPGGSGSTGATDGGGGFCGEPGVMSSGGSGGGVLPAVA